MTPAAFQAAYRQYAQVVSAQTGILASVLLAQWAVETAWGAAINNANNLGNIRCGPTSFCQYASLSDFCDAAVATWHNGYYQAVLSSAPTASPAEQMLAIGESPWDAGHYNNGGGPGSSLVAAYKELPMADTVGDITPQNWLTDLAIRIGNFLGSSGQGNTTITVTAEQLLQAIKAVGTPPPAQVNLQPVLDAIANLSVQVAAIKAKTDADLK